MTKPTDQNDDLKKLIEQHGELEGHRIYKKQFEVDEGKEALDYVSTIIDLKDLNPDLACIQELNDKHIFINNFGGKSCVTTLQYNEVTEKEILSFIPLDTFKNIYCNQIVEKAMTKAMVWLASNRRKTVDSVIFEPKYNPGIVKIGDKNYLNLWEGFGVVPTKGSWYRTKRHIYHIICNKNKERFKYVVRWLAWAVQNPDKQAEVVIALKGKKGTGKSFLFMQFQKIFGRHGMSVSDPNRLMGKHTGHFRLLSFLFCDEVYYPGDKSVEGRLKAIITQDSLDVEGKFQDAVTIKNRLHICMTTNNDRVILASADERRYFVDTVSDRYAKGAIDNKTRDEYFNKLWGEMSDEGGGKEAMLYDLLNMDLKGFHPRYDIPDTQEMDEQKSLSLNAIEQCMRTMLDEGFFSGEKKTYGRDDVVGYFTNMDTVSNYMENQDKYTAKFSMVKKANLIKKLGAEKTREGGTGRVKWWFPELQVMRKNFEKEFGRTAWSNLDTKWTIVKSEY